MNATQPALTLSLFIRPIYRQIRSATARGFGLTIAICSCLFGISPTQASNCKSSVFYVRGALDKAPSITVTGKLTRKFAWGPPNFGEHPKTDSHWHPWILQLDHPIQVKFQGADQLQTMLRKIQVRGKFELNGAYNRFRERHIEVSGTLYQASAPSDETKAVLEATNIALSNRPHCPA